MDCVGLRLELDLRLVCLWVVLPPRWVAQRRHRTPSVLIAAVRMPTVGSMSCGSPSMATEQQTKRPPATSIGTGAESGDETPGVGTTWSVLQPRKGISRLASTPRRPFWGVVRAAALVPQRRHRRCRPTVLPRPDRTGTIRQRSRASIYIPFTKHELIREQHSCLVM